jgi:hypothetical protein
MPTVLTARNNTFERVDETAWRNAVAAHVTHMPRRLAFMTPAHHRVRNAAVLGLPRNGGRPLSMAQLSAAAGVPEAATREIAAELERNLFFVVRGGEDHISWAFPVTCDRTPHRLMFDSGEAIFGA